MISSIYLFIEFTLSCYTHIHIFSPVLCSFISILQIFILFFSVHHEYYSPVFLYAKYLWFSHFTFLYSWHRAALLTPHLQHTWKLLPHSYPFLCVWKITCRHMNVRLLPRCSSGNSLTTWAETTRWLSNLHTCPTSAQCVPRRSTCIGCLRITCTLPTRSSTKIRGRAGRSRAVVSVLAALW